jgi:hypothetical protein
MNVQTTADDNIAKAKQHLEEAKMLLYSVVNDNNGYTDYTKKYQQQIKDTLVFLFQEPLKPRR